LKIILLLAFILNAILLLLSLGAGMMNPKYFWPPAMIKLFFIVWLAVHVLFLIVFLLLKSRPLSILGVVILLLCLPSIFKFIGLHPFHNQDASGKKLRIMTYNVMGFDWYDNKKNAHDILNIIRRQNPDVVCMQEYMMRADDKFKLIDTLRLRDKYKYYKEHIIVTTSNNYYFGMAIFSKYPLKNFKGIPFGNSLTNGACFTDLIAGRDTIRLISVHFQSFALSKREYVYESFEERGRVKRSRLFKITMNKMRNAFRKKSEQTKEVREVIESSPHPVILCGDFNDTPLSYTYSELTKKLDDAYLATNGGIGATFAGNIPFLRIDFILADKAIKPLKAYVVPEKASDHYPVVCDFSLNNVGR
jgi:endonuclease/exonuclease/phosphatase family metal-dependent hydrolase